MPTMIPPSLPSETRLEAARGKAAICDEYVLSKRGEIGAEFEYLRNNLQRYAQLTSLTNAPKLKGCLGTLSQSTDQGESSGTRLACGPVPHPALERGVDENPKPLSGNRTEKAKVSDVVVRSTDASSLSDSKTVANVEKIKLFPHTYRWERRRVRRNNRRLQGLEIQQAISKFILENVNQFWKKRVFRVLGKGTGDGRTLNFLNVKPHRK